MGMDIVVDTGHLIGILSRIQGISSKKTNMDITSGVHLSSKNDRLFISVNNLETGFIGSVPFNGMITSTGDYVLNSKIFYNIVKSIDSMFVNIEIKKGELAKISGGNAVYNVVCMDQELFPLVTIPNDIVYHKISTNEFKRIVEVTSMIVVEPNEPREHLLGVFFDRDGCASTDIKRLVKILFDQSSINRALVPKKGLQNAIKCIDSEYIEFGMNDSVMHIKSAYSDIQPMHDRSDKDIVIRLLNGQFPDTKSVLSFEHFNRIRIDKESFLSVIKRMSILGNTGLVFNFLKDKLEIIATNPEIGESKEEIQIDYAGEDVSIGYNPNFFSDALNAIVDDTIDLYFLNNEKPCILIGSEDKTLINVIMPMRI